MRSIIVCSILISACGEQPLEGELSAETDVGDPYHDNGGLRWGSADNPSIFDGSLVLELASLPTSGEVPRAPWPGHYWPTYRDSINYRWGGAGTPSPAEKYGAAFGVTDIEGKVSRSFGIARYSDRTECSDNTACKSELGEQCAKRRGEAKGRCIPTWWGVCHAWAPAAILEPEPVRPVTHNGTEFKVQDIKALLTVLYDRVNTKFVSLRCDDADGQNQIEYDKYGRPTGADAACMDTNPGTFHVILANYLGIKRQSFVHDRMFDHEVWNHPVRAFRVTSMREVNAAEANGLIGATPEAGTHAERSGSVAQNTWSHQGSFAVTPGQRVKVAMTGTADADLYVRFGKEPALDGFDCRPYDWGSTETCELEAPAGATSVFVSVRGYEPTSSFALAIDIGGTAGGYIFNDQAKKLFHVELEVRYMDGSAPGADGNLAGQADRYTGLDRYAYVLEVDERGRIFGGEWIGASKKKHPDFLWLPTTRSAQTVAEAISYANVKALLDKSVGNEGGTGGDQTVTRSGTVARGAWQYYGPFNVGSGSLVATMTGTGDADLYVRRGSQPTASAYDCRPYADGSNEECTVAGPGQIYVAVNGYADSTFELRVRYPGASGGAPTPTAHLNVSGTVARGESKPFSVPVVAGRKIVVRTTGPADVDLYVALDSVPTPSNYLKSSTGSSGVEQIEVTPATSGTLHIVVYGYAASAFTLTTADS